MQQPPNAHEEASKATPERNPMSKAKTSPTNKGSTAGQCEPPNLHVQHSPTTPAGPTRRRRLLTAPVGRPHTSPPTAAPSGPQYTLIYLGERHKEIMPFGIQNEVELVRAACLRILKERGLPESVSFTLKMEGETLATPVDPEIFIFEPQKAYVLELVQESPRLAHKRRELSKFWGGSPSVISERGQARWKLLKQRLKERKQGIFVNSDPRGSIPFYKKIAYGLPELAKTGPVNLLVVVHMLTRYEKLGATLAILAFFVAAGRSIDVLTDPLMASITDSAHTRWGRRRPFMFVGCFFYALLLSLLCTPWSTLIDRPEIGLWFGVLYILFFLADTLTNVPHNALGQEITTSQRARRELFFVNKAFAMIGMLGAAVLPVVAEIAVKRARPCDVSECDEEFFQAASNGSAVQRSAQEDCELEEYQDNCLQQDIWLSFSIVGISFSVYFLCAMLLCVYLLRENPEGEEEYRFKTVKGFANPKQVRKSQSAHLLGNTATGPETRETPSRAITAIVDADAAVHLDGVLEERISLTVSEAAKLDDVPSAGMQPVGDTSIVPGQRSISDKPPQQQSKPMVMWDEGFKDQKERPSPEHAGAGDKVSAPRMSKIDIIVPTLLGVLENRPFRTMIIPWVLDTTLLSLLATMMPYFAVHVVCEDYDPTDERTIDDEKECDSQILLGMALCSLLLGALIAMPLWHLIARRFGDITAWQATNLLNALTNGLLIFVGSGDQWLTVGISLINGFPIGAVFLTDNILGLTIDYDELRAGVRNEASFTMFSSFVPKIVAVPAQAFPIAVIAAAGFKASKDGVSQEQSAWVVFLIRAFFVYIPTVLALVSFAVKYYTWPFRNAEEADRKIKKALQQFLLGKPFEDPLTGLFRMPFKAFTPQEHYWRTLLDHFPGPRPLESLLDETKGERAHALIRRSTRRAWIFLCSAVVAYICTAVSFPLVDEGGLSWIPAIFVIGGGMMVLGTIFNILARRAAVKLAHEDVDEVFLMRLLAYRQGKDEYNRKDLKLLTSTIKKLSSKVGNLVELTPTDSGAATPLPSDQPSIHIKLAFPRLPTAIHEATSASIALPTIPAGQSPSPVSSRRGSPPGGVGNWDRVKQQMAIGGGHKSPNSEATAASPTNASIEMVEVEKELLYRLQELLCLSKAPRLEGPPLPAVMVEAVIHEDTINAAKGQLETRDIRGVCKEVLDLLQNPNSPLRADQSLAALMEDTLFAIDCRIAHDDPQPSFLSMPPLALPREAAAPPAANCKDDGSTDGNGTVGQLAKGGSTTEAGESCQGDTANPGVRHLSRENSPECAFLPHQVEEGVHQTPKGHVHAHRPGQSSKRRYEVTVSSEHDGDNHSPHGDVAGQPSGTGTVDVALSSSVAE
ncbi:unnamed protein product [Vitrella brassicaformis CCMP3155]|uniref:Uncharacterized protein n=2 Tax=Vitrella brassicaformis TaxID=1169539 RepID=A0A0G4FEX5_VITBC|nr:unnamed protein product [Vitrella brassicaformis CCMP3155]|eukprot:CEM11563.1 unnamed protein product [Vitrella brassicaformis CCMP3155]